MAARFQERGGKNYRDGLRAETLAALLLRLKGYRILARRYKTPVGEIDIVARRFGRLAFVEVKASAGRETALTALTAPMRARIARAAEHFLARHPGLERLTLGFDLITVAAPCFPRHLPNAWRHGE